MLYKTSYINDPGKQLPASSVVPPLSLQDKHLPSILQQLLPPPFNTTISLGVMAPSPPTEAEILQSYLLHSSPLSTILPYSTFQSLVPSASRGQNPSHLKRLYRDLQFQQDIKIDDVRRRIEDECRRSSTLTARLARQIRREENETRGLQQKTRKRKRVANTNDDEEDDGPNQATHDEDESDDDDDDDEAQIDIAIDTHLHGPLGSTLPAHTPRNNHTTDSLLKAMQAAKQDLHSEIAALEIQIATVHKDCEERVGSLSDLRYGRFAQQNRVSNQSALDGQTQIQTQTSMESEIVSALEELRTRLR